MTHAATRARSGWDELDAWVIEELDAITRDRRRSARASAEDMPARLRAVPDVSEPSPGDAPAFDDAATLGDEPADGMMPLFDEAETTFIERSAEWLRPRANADMVLEEIWRLVVADQAVDDALDPPAAADPAGATAGEPAPPPAAAEPPDAPAD